MCIFICAYKGSFLHAHISIQKCIFCALTCLLSMWSTPKHTKTCEIKGNKGGSAQGKSKGHKKGAINPTVQNWKGWWGWKDVTRMMRRWRRIVDRSLDRKERAKKHKEENNQYITFQPFKTEKNGKDEKMLTRRARRRRRIVNRSPG